MLARFTRLPTDDEMKFVADLTVAMQAKETTSHSDALDLFPEGSRPCLKWFTQFPPSLHSRDRIVLSLLIARGWISNRGDWLGHAKGRKGQGKGKQGPNESTSSTEYEQLVQCPDSYIRGSRIHRVAQGLVVDGILLIGTRCTIPKCGKGGRRTSTCTGSGSSQRRWR
jgi:hypothetical protein